MDSGEVAERAKSLAQAAASVRAEGLEISADAGAIMERWARGEVSTTRMRELVRTSVIRALSEQSG